MIRWDMGTRPSFLSATVITLACAVGSLFAQTPVRVATWNIQDVGPRGSDEYAATLAILDRIGADVVGINEFNEIGGTNAEENFYNLADDAGYPFTVLPATNPFGSLRNALLSKYPFAAVTIHTSEGLSGDPDAKDITRLIIEVEIDLGADARVLTVAVEHWKAASGNNNEFRRAVESIRMAQVVGDLVSDQDAYVLMGDVNEELENVPLRPNPFRSLPRGLPQSFSLGADLQAILEADGIVNDPFHHIIDTAQTSLLDAQQLDGNDATFPASGRRIDYVFVSCALADLEPPAEVYDSADEGLPGGLPKYGEPPPPNASAVASDHLPVFTDLIVPAAQSILPGDLDKDGDIDLMDYALFVTCLVGPGGGVAVGCEPADVDGDADVDARDFSTIQVEFTGPG